MREVKRPLPHETLERILMALEQELIEATDGELLQAASDLGMKPGMRGSAAFLGLRYPAKFGLRDFFAAGSGPETRAAIEQLRRAQRPQLAEDEPAPPRPLRGPRTRKRPDKNK